MCGVWAYWTVADLYNQHDGGYAKYASRIITVIRMAGECIDGEDGVRAAKAQIVAYWVAEEDPRAARACLASIPATRQIITETGELDVPIRRFHDRDVMIHMYGLHESPEEGN